MQRQQSENIWMHRFAVLTSCCTFLLIIAGGLVTSTDSGLAVPDWPLSYGQVMPPMVGGIFYEHGHRMVATFVGFLTTILAVWLWRREERRWVRRLGWVALIAVMVQGVLGGITVLYLLPTPVSVAHATLAQSFFCLTMFLALVTSPRWKESGEHIAVPRGLMSLVVSTIAVVFVQLILGAWMRHEQAGLAIPDFPLSYGALLPPLSASSLADVNSHRLALDLGPVTLGQIWIHFAHRLWAVFVVVFVFLSVTRVLKVSRNMSALRDPALAVLGLIIFQVFLGALTVWTGKHVAVATAHVATGALLLASTMVLTARMVHLTHAVPVPGSVSDVQGVVTT